MVSRVSGKRGWAGPPWNHRTRAAHVASCRVQSGGGEPWITRFPAFFAIQPEWWTLNLYNWKPVDLSRNQGFYSRTMPNERRRDVKSKNRHSEALPARRFS
jgi:hypothetical protein